MITNQLSFILTVAEVLTDETPSPSNPEAQSPASGLLWIALNKVGTLTLIQVELLLHTVWSTVTVGCFKMNLRVVLILLIFVHLYRCVLGLFVFVVQLWSVLKWRCFRSPSSSSSSSSSCPSHPSSICSFFTLAAIIKVRWKTVFIQQSQQQVDFWVQQTLWWCLPDNHVCILMTPVPLGGQQQLVRDSSAGLNSCWQIQCVYMHLNMVSLITV